MEAKMVEVIVEEIVRRPAPPKDVLEAWTARQLPEASEPVRQRWTAGGTGEATVMRLREREGERVLELWIGPLDGNIIEQLLAGQATLRPMAPELMVRLLEAGQMTVERVAVTRLQDEIFYATLWVKAPDGTHEIDARPSDGVALALRLKAPLFVDEAVLEAERDR